MRHLLRFSVLLLLSLAIAGCHHRRKAVLPPRQAEAPIVTKLPPIPPLTVPNVQLGKPEPPAPVVPFPPVELPKVVKAPAHHRRPIRHRSEAAEDNTKPSVPSKDEVSGAEVLGPLSTGDAATNPHQDEATQHLIESTEDRLGKVSKSQRSHHKEALAQIQSFLSQAQQAWAMNDMVGAQTLANKAKIMLDELLK